MDMARKLLNYEQLQACLFSRIPPADFMAHDCSPLLDEETQQKTVSDLLKIAETNAYYIKLFLAQYVRLLEKSASVIDELYELYCEPRILNAQERPPTATDLLQYAVDSKGEYISIRETPRIISGAGTTGLRTWEAALFLSNYLNNLSSSSELLRGKNILELGTGTGLVSLALMKKHTDHGFSSIELTDGDSALLEKLPDAIQLNGLADSVPVKVSQLIWGEQESYQDPKKTETIVDVIVAADVTYDASVVPQLCDTLSYFFEGGTSVAYVAATIRNLDTIEVWEKELEDRFSWSVCARLSDPHMSDLRCWFRKGTPEIRLYEIKPRHKEGAY
ncbi:hypothetical protein JCM33374_g1184 [Metschnikowia sp. JCM 33374]|nr:hypothetical protein JCM33374_g1184 [Metschnikowia sp. JCM 33374]